MASGFGLPILDMELVGPGERDMHLHFRDARPDLWRDGNVDLFVVRPKPAAGGR